MKEPSRPHVGKPESNRERPRGRHRRAVVDPKQVDLEADASTLTPAVGNPETAGAPETGGSSLLNDGENKPKLTPAQQDKIDREHNKSARKAQREAAKANKQAVKAAQRLGAHNHRVPNYDLAERRPDSPWDSTRRSNVDTGLLDRLEEQFFQQRRKRRLRIAGLIGVLVGIAIVLYVLFFSPLFSYQLAKCHVTGARNVDINKVCQATERFEGRSITSLATAGVAKTVLSEVPELKDAKVKPAWLHGLEIQVFERVPVATVRQNGKVVGVDRGGVVLEIAPGDVGGLPRLDVDMEKLGGTTQKLVDAALVSFGDMPEELRAQVESVTSDDPAQLQFKMRDGRTLIWGNSHDSLQKAKVAQLLFTVQGVKVVDVSNPERPSTR